LLLPTAQSLGQLRRGEVHEGVVGEDDEGETAVARQPGHIPFHQRDFGLDIRLLLG
jgi:hypothetical protein